MTAAERASLLVANLRSRREWYARMAELAREQQRLIRENPDGLAEFVEKKRAVMAQLERLAAEAPDVRAEWEGLRPELDAATAAGVEAELAVVAKVLGELVKEEEEGRRLAEAARNGTAVEMQRAVDAKRAAAAYGKPKAPAPRFMDRNE